MKLLILTIGLFLFIGTINAQNSFANIPESQPSELINTSALKDLKNKTRAYPQRLDFKYEFLNGLSLNKDWNQFTNEVIKLIDQSYETNHAWLWDQAYDAIGEDAEGFILNTIQDYVFILYITDDVAQHDNIRAICDLVLEHTPGHVDFMTYPAMTYDAAGDYVAGMHYLQKAEQAHPANGMVALLMAENYEKQGKVNTAKAYYQKAIRYGEESDAKEALAHMERLNFK